MSERERESERERVCAFISVGGLTDRNLSKELTKVQKRNMRSRFFGNKLILKRKKRLEDASHHSLHSSLKDLSESSLAS